jgi:hypothetical protein
MISISEIITVQNITSIKLNDVICNLVPNHNEYGCLISSCGIKMYYLPALNYKI